MIWTVNGTCLFQKWRSQQILHGIKDILATNDKDDQRQVLRHKIVSQKEIHDSMLRKELYLINNQKVSTITYNLGVLLGSDGIQE